MKYFCLYVLLKQHNALKNYFLKKYLFAYSDSTTTLAYLYKVYLCWYVILSERFRYTFVNLKFS